MRNKIDGWPSKAATPDSGAGSGAKKNIKEMSPYEVEQVQELYKILVGAVSGSPESVQRAALLACASDFSLDYIITKATEAVSSSAIANAVAKAAEKEAELTKQVWCMLAELDEPITPELFNKIKQQLIAEAVA